MPFEKRHKPLNSQVQYDELKQAKLVLEKESKSYHEAETQTAPPLQQTAAPEKKEAPGKASLTSGQAGVEVMRIRRLTKENKPWNVTSSLVIYSG